MTKELEDTLHLIQDRIDSAGTHSVFIKMSDFPWYHERNGQLTKLNDAGYITKPRFFDNGVDISLTANGREYLSRVSKRIRLNSPNEDMPCPVCGNRAKVIQTTPARDWAELHCENCLTYAIKADALEDVENLYLFSGFVRHHQPDMMSVQCHDKDSVKQITSKPISRDEQLRYLLKYYYQKMTCFGQFITFDPYPAIAYTKDESDLKELVDEGAKRGLLLFENGLISVTESGEEFMEKDKDTKRKPSVFISYNWGSDEIADFLETQLKPYADVKRDKTSVGPWDDLAAFMNSIRDQDFAVLIISDVYLQSTACLYEVMQLMKEKYWDQHVMYVVTDDAHGVYDPVSQLRVIESWENKETELEEAIKRHNPAAVSNQAEELRKIKLITLHIGEFMHKVANTNNPGVKEAIAKVIDRVKGRSEGGR